MNLVFEMRGAGVTVAEKEHDAVRLNESVAVHCTVVEPTPMVDPDVGEHETFTGVDPPVTWGAANVIGAPAVEVALTVIDGGHVIAGGSATTGGGCGGGVGETGVGVVGELQAAAITSAAATDCLSSQRSFAGRDATKRGINSSRLYFAV